MFNHFELQQSLSEKNWWKEFFRDSLETSNQNFSREAVADMKEGHRWDFVAFDFAVKANSADQFHKQMTRNKMEVVR